NNTNNTQQHTTTQQGVNNVSLCGVCYDARKLMPASKTDYILCPKCNVDVPESAFNAEKGCCGRCADVKEEVIK
ncbi:MAG: hypothetical protein V1734_00070, partial [Nanoarchaeota archaeon]